MIFHLCEEMAWNEGKQKGLYAPPSLAKEGFIHLSTFGQVIATANRVYKNAVKPMVLVVDNNMFSQKILKWEGRDGNDFPHIYKTLHPDEIVAEVVMERGKDGKFITTPGLIKWARAVRLETKRLVLREFQMDDFQAVQAYASDPQIMTYMVWGPNEPLETRKFLSRTFKWQSKEPRDEFHLAVIEKETRELIGACHISIRDADRSTGILGFILRADRHGQGFATELCQKLIEYGFETLKLEKVEATCDERNTASLKVMEKIGLSKEMILENEIVKGEPRNTVVCALLKEKFFEN
jgi:[ribosomal protein S5]-alanine N-acetyltransferase